MTDLSLDNASSSSEAPKQPSAQFTVELPAGGSLRLQSADEVTIWEETQTRYLADYNLVKTNDLILLGAILTQSIAMYRAQQDMSDVKKTDKAMGQITKASDQIRELEKSLGIDKKTRESGGQHTIADYVTQLKRAAHLKGVRISERVKAFEAFNMELRTKIRILRNGDEEDKAYHGITEESILEWAEKELAEIEEADKKWAKDKGRIFVGKL